MAYTRNLSLNKYKQNTTKKRGFGQTELALWELEDCISSKLDVEQTIDEMVLVETLNNFLAALPKINRMVFMWRYWYLRKINDIAEDCGMSESKSMLFRTRNELKKYLEKGGIIVINNEKLLYAIGLIDEGIIEEAAPKVTAAITIKKHSWVKKFIPIAACAAIALFTIFVLPQINKMPINNTPDSNNPIIPGQQTDKNNAVDESSIQPIQMNIIMNDFETFPPEKVVDIGLWWDDYISMSIDELNEYFGMNIAPPYLPEKLEREMVVDVAYGNLGIFKKLDGTVYYDNNELKYESADKTQSIIIVVAKGHLPKYDILNVYEGDLKASHIDGNNVFLTHYKDDKGEHYYAEFLYNDVGVNLWGNNISQDDFIKVVAAYFEKG